MILNIGTRQTAKLVHDTDKNEFLMYEEFIFKLSNYFKIENCEDILLIQLYEKTSFNRIK